ncbi:MAG: AAA family ATPase [Thermoleophilales bacterium]|nr:AAA family ATPase [Thermoleophilales bacterium]
MAVYENHLQTSAWPRTATVTSRLPEVEHHAARSLTGCGKTLLARLSREFSTFAFAIADATALTEAGYVGEDVGILLKLIRRPLPASPKAETEIIIDEIDKITHEADNPLADQDVSGRESSGAANPRGAPLPRCRPGRSQTSPSRNS